jgi:DNA-binding winged helix-turn-helix (wHTH) protein
MNKPAASVYEFGPFRLDTVKRLLMRDGEAVPLTPKTFEVLIALVENSDRVLEKSELMTAIWPDSFVEESNLTQSVFMLRKALGESSGEHRYIVTVPGRGYRFVASVSQLADEGSDVVLERHSRSTIFAEREEETDSSGEPEMARVSKHRPSSEAYLERAAARELD